MLFFVKVRLDTGKMVDLGKKLQAGVLPTHPLSTYCLKDDPAVGLNIWEAEDRADFDRKFAPHREYYSEIIEVTPVILPQESMGILMKQISQ
jgi:hypothetical protein